MMQFKGDGTKHTFWMGHAHVCSSHVSQGNFPILKVILPEFIFGKNNEQLFWQIICYFLQLLSQLRNKWKKYNPDDFATILSLFQHFVLESPTKSHDKKLLHFLPSANCVRKMHEERLLVPTLNPFFDINHLCLSVLLSWIAWSTGYSVSQCDCTPKIPLKWKEVSGFRWVGLTFK